MTLRLAPTLSLVLAFAAAAPALGAPQLPAPELLEPADGARLGPSDGPPALAWTAVSGAKGYEVELALDKEFELGSGPLPTSGAGLDLAELVPLADWEPVNATLFWRARAVAGPTPGAWSPAWLFHKSVLGPPELLEPELDARFTAGDRPPLVAWEPPAGAATHQLEFALDEGFEELLGRIDLTEPFLDLSSGDQAAWDAYVGVLYWRVAGVNAGGVPGPWGPAWWFAKSTLSPPQLTAPAPEAAFAAESSPADFTWSQDPAAAVWEMQLAADEDCAEVFGSAVLAEPGLFLGQILAPEEWWLVYGTFWWRVAARTEDGVPGPWSGSRRFSKIGRHRFMAYGDSVTDGECVASGYIDIITPGLTAIFPDAVIVKRGIPGAKSMTGSDRLAETLREVCPQYVFIQFGSNDCVDSGNCDPPFQCDVDLHFAAMVEICRSFGTEPIISTLVPINPISRFAGAQGTASYWSDLLRGVGISLGVVVADLENWFFDYGYLPDLYCYAGDPDNIDWVHPNELGYGILSDCFIDALLRLLA